MSLNTHINCLKQIGILEVKICIKVSGLHKSLCAWNLGHSWGYELHRFFQQHPFQGNIKDASPHCISGGAFFPVYIPPSIFSPDSLPNSWNSTLVCLRDHHGDRFGTIFRDSSQEGSWASLAPSVSHRAIALHSVCYTIANCTLNTAVPHSPCGIWILACSCVSEQMDNMYESLRVVCECILELDCQSLCNCKEAEEAHILYHAYLSFSMLLLNLNSVDFVFLLIFWRGLYKKVN